IQDQQEFTDVKPLDACHVILTKFNPKATSDDQIASYRVHDICSEAANGEKVIPATTGSFNWATSPDAVGSGPSNHIVCTVGCKIVANFHNSFCSGPGMQTVVDTFVFQDATGEQWVVNVVTHINSPMGCPAA